MTKRSNPALWLLSLGNGGVDRPFNEAVGGTVTEIDDYNGTGEKWRVHTFTGNGTLDVSTAVQPFRVLCVGGGGVAYNNGGAGGEVVEVMAATLTTGALPVTVGAGGAPSRWAKNNGGASSVGNITANGGSNVTTGGNYGVEGQSGNGGWGYNTVAGAQGSGGFGANGQPGIQKSTSGTATYYGGGGGSFGFSVAGVGGAGGGGNGYKSTPGERQPGAPNTGGGAGGNRSSGEGDSAGGGSGIVIVAYQIG